MAGSITHAFASGIADGTDATLVRPSNWNAGHVFSLSNVDITDSQTGFFCNTRLTGDLSASYVNISIAAGDAVASQIPLVAIHMALQLGGF